MNWLAAKQTRIPPKRGTNTINLQLFNTFETDWVVQLLLFGCSWDIQIEFNSMSSFSFNSTDNALGSHWRSRSGSRTSTKPCVHNYFHSTWAVGRVRTRRVQPSAFNLERGTGQTDSHSPFTWIAVFDVRVTTLEHKPACKHHYILCKPDRSLCAVRDILFADDLLQPFGATREGWQRTTNLVSTS